MRYCIELTSKILGVAMKRIRYNRITIWRKSLQPNMVQRNTIHCNSTQSAVSICRLTASSVAWDDHNSVGQNGVHYILPVRVVLDRQSSLDTVGVLFRRSQLQEKCRMHTSPYKSHISNSYSNSHSPLLFSWSHALSILILSRHPTLLLITESYRGMP